MLEDVGWLNAIVFEENVYPDLVKVFYSNMDCSAEKENRVITTVGGVSIEFDDSDLNSILGTYDGGLQIFHLGNLLVLVIMFILMLLRIYVVVLTFRMMIVLSIFAPNVFVFKLGYYFILFRVSCFLDQAIWMRFLMWMLP